MSPFTRDQLFERFDYNPETGFITHKTHSIDDFKDPGEFLKANRKAGKRAEVFREHKSTSYYGVCIGSKQMPAHRAAYLMYHGKLPKFIDHVNGDSFDNRIENLRPASRLQNNRNSSVQKNNKTGVPGVSFRKKDGKLIAMIGHKGKNLYLGTFDNLEDAKKARKDAERLLGYHENHGQRKSQRLDPGLIEKAKSSLK